MQKGYLKPGLWFWFSSIKQIQIHFFRSKSKWTLCV